MFDSPLFLMLVSCALFLSDVSLYFLCHHQFLYLILIAYIFELLSTQNKYFLLFFGSLICLESFIFYGTLWAPLAALIPLTFLEIQYRHNFYQSWGYKVGVGSLFIIAQIVIIEPFLLGLPLGIAYTFFKVCSNMLVVGILSLKDFNQNKRDNRGTWL